MLHLEIIVTIFSTGSYMLLAFMTLCTHVEFNTNCCTFLDTKMP